MRNLLVCALVIGMLFAIAPAWAAGPTDDILPRAPEELSKITTPAPMVIDDPNAVPTYDSPDFISTYDTPIPRVTPARVTVAPISPGIAPASTSAPQARNLTYRNETWHYRLSYPSSWRMQDQGETVLWTASSPPAVATVTAGDVAETFDEPLTDDEVLELLHDGAPGALEKVFDNFTLSRVIFYPSGTVPVYEFIYTGSLDDGSPVTGNDIVFVHDGYTYSINYLAGRSDYTAHFQEFKGMVGSFRFV